MNQVAGVDTQFTNFLVSPRISSTIFKLLFFVTSRLRPYVSPVTSRCLSFSVSFSGGRITALVVQMLVASVRMVGDQIPTRVINHN